MEFVLIVLILGVIAFVGYRLYKQKRITTQKANKPEPMHVPYDKPLDFSDGGMDPSHDLMQTEPGDVLYYSLDLEDFNKHVMGVVNCKQHGSPAWLAVLLDDGVWLTFEPGVRSEFSRWQKLPDGESLAFPSPTQTELVYGGVTYKRNDFGHATYTSKGDTGMRDSGTLEFAEFRSPEGPDGTVQFISFEMYDDNDPEVSVGEAIMASALTRLPKGESSLSD